MTKISKELIDKTGLVIPTILLPKDNTDFKVWSVVACDQYSSQPDYWERVDKNVNTEPSTLRLILPEVYLEEDNWQDRIKKINENMKTYLAEKVFREPFEGFILIDRKTTHAPSRKGLIVALDLEKYDFNKGSETLIRATEGTVVDRLPPRIKIRENASLELPHIMVLIDDPEKTVIEPLFSDINKFESLYDFELMENGGHIKGYGIKSSAELEKVYSSITKLMDTSVFTEKYNVDEKAGVLLFAVGDGNHSLASAKGHWENVKKSLSEESAETHPARFALVELVNVHDDGIIFEPIHRVVFNCKISELENFAYEYNVASNSNLKIVKHSQSAESLSAAAFEGTKHIIPFVTSEEKGVFCFESPSSNLPVGSLQSFLDAYLALHPNAKIDYIHGEDATRTLGTAEGNIAFYLPNMSKFELFKTVIVDGVLPRKTFSMGEAEEKRFYLECRKIVP